MVKRISIAAGMTACILMLGGCEMIDQEKWTPQESVAIQIHEDGGLTEYTTETLDASYYKVDELEQMITSEIADYNKQHGEDTVVMQKLESEGSNVSLEMKYASAKDYAEFNNVEFYYGSMINAQLEGYLFDDSYYRVKDGVVQGSAVSGSEVLKKMAAEVLIVQAPLEVNVPGNVIFVSTNADVPASDTVYATGKREEQEDEGLVLPSSAVFVEEKDTSFAEAVAANRVYIIFEKE